MRAGVVAKRVGVLGLLAAPAVVVAVVAYQPDDGAAEVVEPVDVEVAIGPHDARVRLNSDFGGSCMEVTAVDRGATNCMPVGEELAFVFGFGDGEGDAEFAALALVPADAADVRLVPEEDGAEAVAGELVELEGRDELLAVAYWSWPAVAPEPPRLEVLDASGSVLLSA